MKKILISIALMSICTITKAQNSTNATLTEQELEKKLKFEWNLRPNILIGSTIRFDAEKINNLENFFYMSPDTLWIRQRKNPKLGNDFYLCKVYKGLENSVNKGNSKRIEINGVAYYVDNSGLVEANTPHKYISDRDFLVVAVSKNSKSDTHKKGNTTTTTTRNYLNIQLKDIATNEQFVWEAQLHGLTDVFHNRNDINLLAGLKTTSMGEPLERVKKKITDDHISKIKREFESKKADGKLTVSLTNVEKPSNSQIRFGKTTTEEAGTRYSYTDNYINIIWLPTSTSFHFILTNSSPHSMRIIWDEAVYVNENGMVDKIIHEGVRLMDRNNSQTPTTILKGASLSDLVAPISKIHYDKDWVQRPLFDKSDKGKLDNKTVRISLPLQIQNVTNEYVFTFTVKWEPTHPELQNIEFSEWLEKQK